MTVEIYKKKTHLANVIPIVEAKNIYVMMIRLMHLFVCFQVHLNVFKYTNETLYLIG